MYTELINYAQTDITRNSSSTESGRSRIFFFFFFFEKRWRIFAHMFFRGAHTLFVI
jgi:hypothetical protein